MSELKKSEFANEVVTPIDEAQISDFLQSHPDFFDHNPELLNDLDIPHQRGGAVSLVERQVASLRNENSELKQKLSTIIQLAEENDQLLAKTKQLILELLSVDSSQQLKSSIEETMVTAFNATSCRLWSVKHSDATIPSIQEHGELQMLKRLEERQESYCGLINEDDRDLLFSEDADEVGSAALIPLVSSNGLIGVLAIANSDPDYYRDNMSTGMLDFIGGVLAVQLDRFLTS